MKLHLKRFLTVSLSCSISWYFLHTITAIWETETRSRDVRVLCWVATFPENHLKRAIHVKNTWGRRCDTLLFMSTEYDASLPTVQLNDTGGEGRDFLWGKTKAAFRYVHEHHLDAADWFLKADDNLYVITENLKEMLLQYDPSEALFLGFRYNLLFPQGYMSGGAGYVLSREALRRLVQLGLPNSEVCVRKAGSLEDVELSGCLHNLNVTFVDTQDERGRHRFLPMHIHTHFTPGRSLDTSWFPMNRGPDCCSDKPITFHETTPDEMYIYEYLLYNVKPLVRS